MEISKRRKIGILIAAIIVILVAGVYIYTSNKTKETSNGGQGEELVKIVFALDWTPNTNHTGLFVAKDKGYFKELGLDVEFIQPPEDTATALVAAGKADFGIDFQDTLAPALMEDLPVTTIATILQHNTSGIISLKEDNILSPKDLEGKTYATWDLPIETGMMKHTVELDGGNYNNVNLISTYVVDVVSGLQTDIDAVWIYYGWEGIATKVHGLDTNFYMFKDIDNTLDYYTPIIVANDKFLEENEEITKKFLKACEKGYEYTIDNPEEVAQILLKEDPSLDEELVIESQKWMSSQYKAEAEKWGYIDEERWNAFYNWLYENELIQKEIVGRFSNEYLPK